LMGWIVRVNYQILAISSLMMIIKLKLLTIKA
jgi:hypothetical protein